jgi:hypothetical protein
MPSSIVLFVTFLAILAWGARRFRFLAFLLMVYSINLLLRALSVVYLDVSGPVYSIQMLRDVGGGHASPVLLAFHLMTLAALLLVFRPSVAQRLAAIPLDDPRSPGSLVHARVATVVFIAYCVFVGALFVDLARSGVVPVFQGIERWEYAEQYAGGVHSFLIKYGFIVTFVPGLFYAYGRVLTGRPDNRFLGVLLAIFVYLFLVGHRFSSYYAYGTTFMGAWAMVALRRQFGAAAAATPERERGRHRLLQATAVLLAGAIISYALYVSLVVTRDFGKENALLAFEHRTLVQPGEMWWTSHERVFTLGQLDRAEAFDRVFVHPIADPVRNSTIPYLMVKEIGDQAYPMLDLGLNWGGGYPEILFELCGKVLAWPAGFLIALLMGVLMYWLLEAMLLRRYIRAVLIYYVYFAFILFPLGGMLNFLVAWKFWVKVGAMALWMLYESTLWVRAAAPVPAEAT